jgi:hypothetical protein
MIGNGLRLGGHLHQLHPAAAVFVTGTPELCLLLSVAMAAGFAQAKAPGLPALPPGAPIPGNAPASPVAPPV